MERRHPGHRPLPVLLRDWSERWGGYAVRRPKFRPPPTKQARPRPGNAPAWSRGCRGGPRARADPRPRKLAAPLRLQTDGRFLIRPFRGSYGQQAHPVGPGRACLGHPNMPSAGGLPSRLRKYRSEIATCWFPGQAKQARPSGVARLSVWYQCPWATPQPAGRP
jgi:hypothetical protein